MIPYGRQDISTEDINAVVDVLRSDFLTQGRKIIDFENELARVCQSTGAVAVTNATSALHLGCLALGVEPGDRVWTSPISFVASSNAALYCGAIVDFVDINPNTGLMCPDILRKKLKHAEINNTLPKLIIPVHLGGQSCNMKAIKALADRYNISVLEDASHAIGAKYGGRPVGSCEYSDACVFSFHPVKIITTGEGGALLSRDKEVLQRVSLMRSHGITRDQDLYTEKSHGDWYYQQLTLGFNYRMTELQAALGLSQLNRLDSFIMRRQYLAKRYDQALQEEWAKELNIKPLSVFSLEQSSWHLYIVVCPNALRDKLFATYRANNVLVNLHYIPIHIQPYYRNLGFEPGDYPNSEKYYSEAMSLPLFPGLTDEHQDQVIEVLKSAATEELG